MYNIIVIFFVALSLLIVYLFSKQYDSRNINKNRWEQNFLPGYDKLASKNLMVEEFEDLNLSVPTENSDDRLLIKKMKLTTIRKFMIRIIYIKNNHK